MDKLTLKGQSLFEVIIATGVVAVTLTALVGLITASISNSTFARDRTIANRYTTEALEWIRGKRDQDWTVITQKGSTGGLTYCLNTLPDSLSNMTSRPTASNIFNCSPITGTKFYRGVIVRYNAAASTNELEVEVATLWRDSDGQHESRSVTVLTNWRTN